MSELLSEFRAFFRQYQHAWNSLDAEHLGLWCAPELKVRWVYPDNRVSDWGHDEACNGWVEAFAAYAGHDPKWGFEEVEVRQVTENDVLAIFWVTFEMDGKPTPEINLFVETFRKKPDGWQLIRSFVEASLSRRLFER